MEINYYLNNIEFGEIALVLNSRCNTKIDIKGSSVKEFLLYVATENKIAKALKMLSLDSSVLEKTPSQLTNLENTLVIIAYQLLQGKELVINYLDVLLNYKEETYVKKILIKLAHQYNVKIAIFTNNIKVCFNMIDKIILVKDKEIVDYLPNDFYNMEIYNYIEMPEIIRFVADNIMRGKNLDKYLELSELLKGIYRIC